MTSTTEAVRYELADGIVNLILDDPSQSANTMNQAYADSMAKAVDQLAADDRRRPRVDQGRHRLLGEEDLLRRRRPQAHDTGQARGRARAVRERRGHQGDAAQARDDRQARRRGHQRRRPRWRPRDRPGDAPPHRRRRRLRDRPARGDPRPAARWRRCHAYGPHVRHPGRDAQHPAAGPAHEAGAGQGQGAGRRDRRNAGRAHPGRQGVDRRQRRQRGSRDAAVGPQGLSHARRHPVDRPSSRSSCRRSRRTCASRSRVRPTRRRAPS